MGDPQINKNQEIKMETVMVEHVIKLSKFHTDVLAHNENSVTEYVQQLAVNAAEREAHRLAQAEINTALNDPKKKPTMKMDRDTIVKAKFDAPGYLDAVARRKVAAEAQEAQRVAEEKLRKAREAAK